jgi:hypothetical protein
MGYACPDKIFHAPRTDLPSDPTWSGVEDFEGTALHPDGTWLYGIQDHSGDNTRRIVRWPFPALAPDYEFIDFWTTGIHGLAVDSNYVYWVGVDSGTDYELLRTENDGTGFGVVLETTSGVAGTWWWALALVGGDFIGGPGRLFIAYERGSGSGHRSGLLEVFESGSPVEHEYGFGDGPPHLFSGFLPVVTTDGKIWHPIYDRPGGGLSVARFDPATDTWETFGSEIANGSPWLAPWSSGSVLVGHDFGSGVEAAIVPASFDTITAATCPPPSGEDALSMFPAAGSFWSGSHRTIGWFADNGDDLMVAYLVGGAWRVGSVAFGSAPEG